MAQVIGVYPSVTYPSHTSIVTGVTPERHGIYGNDVFETPDKTPTGSCTGTRATSAQRRCGMLRRERA